MEHKATGSFQSCYCIRCKYKHHEGNKQLEDSKQVDLEIKDEKSEYVHASSPDAEQNCIVEAGENPFEMSKTSTWELTQFTAT
jgi:hypothetical protein